MGVSGLEASSRPTWDVTSAFPVSHFHCVLQDLQL